MELVEWLLTVLDSDERVAQAAEVQMAQMTGAPPDCTAWESFAEDLEKRILYDAEAVVDHIERHDPAAVLADIAAKRAILGLHQPTESGMSCDHCADGYSAGWPRDWPCPTVRALASAYAHRSGYPSAT